MLTAEHKAEAEKKLKFMSSEMDFEKKIKETISTFLPSIREQ
jgi:hypothetical protein